MHQKHLKTVAVTAVVRIVFAILAQPTFADEAGKPNTTDAVAQSTLITFATVQVAPSTPRLQFLFACPDGLDVECRWIAENVGDVAPRELLLGKLMLQTQGPLCSTSYSRPTNGWPLGLYRLELWHKGRVLHIQRYIVDDDQAESK